MKSGLVIASVSIGLMISSIAGAQRKWRQNWEKAWTQIRTCQDQAGLFSCLQSYTSPDSFHIHTFLQKLGRTAKAGTSLQLNGKAQILGVDFFPFAFSGEGDCDAEVLTGIQELNKPWVVNLQTLYAEGSLMDSLQAIYVSAKQAQQNGALAWVAFGPLPEKWQQLNDTLHFPRLFIPAVYLCQKTWEDGQNLGIRAHIRMKDSLDSARVVMLWKENRVNPPALWIICRDHDIQAAWFATLSDVFLHKEWKTQARVGVMWLPDHFPSACTAAFTQYLQQMNAVHPVGLLQINTDTSLSQPRLEICQQRSFWQSLIQPEARRSWSIHEISCEPPFQLMPANMPIARIRIPAALPALSKEALFIHQQVYDYLRQAVDMCTNLAASN
ncbi:MAG: hypothetical protein IRZ29_08430 [Thermoflavifilum sp.]|nr:hypothetical protein [Thermoflavifilum sp.]